MSERITIRFKDGSTKEFRHKGGSYTISLKLTGGWAIVTDEWGATTSYPADTIAETTTTERGY